MLKGVIRVSRLVPRDRDELEVRRIHADPLNLEKYNSERVEVGGGEKSIFVNRSLSCFIFESKTVYFVFFIKSLWWVYV